MEKECVICGQPVYDMNEADIKVGVIISYEPAICEQCYEEKPQEADEVLEESRKRVLEF